MAVKVCEADGVTSTEEKAFLENLGDALGIGKSEAAQWVAMGDEIAASSTGEVSTAMLPALPPAMPVATDANAEVDSLILKYAIQSLRNEAEPIYQKVLPQIREQASTLNPTKVMAMLKGQP
jgi:hypothetical protein